MHYRTLTISMAVLLMMIAGCGRKYRLSDDRLLETSSWQFAHSDIHSTGYNPGAGYAGQLDQIWMQKSSDKPAGPMTIYNGALVYPGTKKKVRFYAVDDGTFLGYVKVKGAASTGLVMNQTIAYLAVGPKRNRLYGIDLTNGDKVFEAPVKDAAAGSIIVNDHLLISSGDGELLSYRLSDNQLAWRFEAEGSFAAPATYGNGKLFQPAGNGKLYAIDPENGQELFQVEVEGPLNGAVTVDDLVWFGDVLGFCYAVDPNDGRLVWKKKLEGPIWTSPVLASDRLIVGHSGGQVVALDRSTGRVLWQHDVAEVVRASPIVVGEHVIVGTMAGSVLVLDLMSGVPLRKVKLRGAVAVPPVSDGKRIYVATRSGRIYCLGEQNDKSERVKD